MSGPAAPRRRAVFLDRDGVLSVPEFRDGRSFAPRRLEDFCLYPDAAAAVRALRAAGFVTVVVTNQPDVGAGLVPREVVEAMHARLLAETAVDRIEVAYETAAAGGPRRKPAPGMLLDAAAALGLDLARSYMLGDRAGDVEAGLRAGCIPVFIDLGYTAEPRPTGQAATLRSLREAVAWILARERDIARDDQGRAARVEETRWHGSRI